MKRWHEISARYLRKLVQSRYRFDRRRVTQRIFETNYGRELFSQKKNYGRELRILFGTVLTNVGWETIMQRKKMERKNRRTYEHMNCLELIIFFLCLDSLEKKGNRRWRWWKKTTIMREMKVFQKKKRERDENKNIV